MVGKKTKLSSAFIPNRGWSHLCRSRRGKAARRGCSVPPQQGTGAWCSPGKVLTPVLARLFPKGLHCIAGTSTEELLPSYDPRISLPRFRSSPGPSVCTPTLPRQPQRGACLVEQQIALSPRIDGNPAKSCNSHVFLSKSF